ncbi:MAG TPA: hypothetical protein VM142_01710 [Acidimicrobiales bacterium]|nr:hypothetical protein [Acidimicrobiales bacterium]
MLIFTGPTIYRIANVWQRHDGATISRETNDKIDLAPHGDGGELVMRGLDDRPREWPAWLFRGGRIYGISEASAKELAGAGFGEFVARVPDPPPTHTTRTQSPAALWTAGQAAELAALADRIAALEALEAKEYAS